MQMNHVEDREVNNGVNEVLCIPYGTVGAPTAEMCL